MSRPSPEILRVAADVDALSRDLVREQCGGDFSRVVRVGGAYLIANSRRHAELLVEREQQVEAPPAPKRRRRKQAAA